MSDQVDKWNILFKREDTLTYENYLLKVMQKNRTLIENENNFSSQ